MYNLGYYLGDLSLVIIMDPSRCDPLTAWLSSNKTPQRTANTLILTPPGAKKQTWNKSHLNPESLVEDGSQSSAFKTLLNNKNTI